ncbi:MAG: hypothetical protein V1887_03970 [Candidatus Aenigmatarchaeota archaeon]
MKSAADQPAGYGVYDRCAKRLIGATVVDASAFAATLVAKNYSGIVQRFWESRISDNFTGEIASYLAFTLPFMIYGATQVVKVLDYRSAHENAEAQPQVPGEKKASAARPVKLDTFEQDELPPYLKGTKAEQYRPIILDQTVVPVSKTPIRTQ